MAKYTPKIEMPEEPAAETAAAPEVEEGKIRSPFRNSRDFCADFFTDQFGHRYYFREASDELQDWMKEQPEQMAKALGITVEALNNRDYSGVSPDKVAQIDKSADSLCTRVLTECLTDWEFEGFDAPPLKEANIKELALNIKGQIVRLITLSTKFGMRQEDFSKPPSPQS